MRDSDWLKGKVALVTGAGRGIGRAVSKALAATGAHVVLAARTGDELESVRKEITSAGGHALSVPTDVSAEASVSSLFSAIYAHHGRLDILINNAGIGAFGRIEDTSTEELDRVLAVNVRGTFLCCREALRRMKARREGTIINISSVVGFKGYPNQSVYTASKHAVMGLTKSLSLEAWPHDIRVSAILPGGVDTELITRARPDIPGEELMQPEDVAEAVVFLLSLSDRAAVDEIYIRRRKSQPW